MNNVDEKGEGFVVDRPHVNPLTEAELEAYRKEGWGLSLEDTITPSHPASVPMTRYIFRRINK